MLRHAGVVATCAALVAGCRDSSHSNSTSAHANVQTFAVTGEVRAVQHEIKTVVVQHELVPDFMPAMTMPFRVLSTNELARLNPGDEVRFRLTISNEESWIDRIVTTRSANPTSPAPAIETATNPPRITFTLTNIPDFSFTNEHGQPVSLRDFSGHAIAFTFFFTRCPVPEYCPRLARNFQAASQKLKSMPNAPTNWRLLSISFDAFDTPPVLRAYARRYNYDSNHWSFLTGPTNQMLELARGFGVKVTPAGSANFTHGFATVVFDAQGRLQSRWPVSGDTSDTLAKELLKGATNAAAQPR